MQRSHLEELGIGRPSTYASIMKSLQDRGYCSMVSRTLRPQQRGQLVTALLTSESLEPYVQTNFTARLEADLDAISAGELEQLPFLKEWWSHFSTAVSAVEQTDTMQLREEVADKCAWTLFPSAGGVVRPPLIGSDGKAASTLQPTAPAPPPAANGQPAAAECAAGAGAPLPKSERICPSCGVGHMSLKFSKFGPFVGCSEYPSCGWTTRPREPWADADAQPTVDKLALGVLAPGALPDAAVDYSGLEVSVRDGPVGWYVQLGGNVSHEQQQLTPPPDIKALKVTQLREQLEQRGLAATGRKADLAERLLQAADLRHLVPHKRVSVPADTKPMDVTMAKAERLLSLPKVLGGHPSRGDAITLRQGRFGPYVTMPTKGEYPEQVTALEEANETAMVMCSLPKRVSIWDCDLTQAVELLEGKMVRDAKRRTAAKEAKQAKAAAKGATTKRAISLKSGTKAASAGRSKKAKGASKATKKESAATKASTKEPQPA